MYLYRPGSIWYSRVSVPDSLKQFLPSSSLRYSLRTASIKKARQRSRLIVAKIHGIFHDLNKGAGPMTKLVGKLTPAKIQEIIREYVTETVQQDEFFRASSTRRLNSDSYDEKLLEIQDWIAILRERLCLYSDGRCLQSQSNDQNFLEHHTPWCVNKIKLHAPSHLHNHVILMIGRKATMPRRVQLRCLRVARPARGGASPRNNSTVLRRCAPQHRTGSAGIDRRLPR